MFKVIPLNESIVDAVKPSFCTFMGTYVIRHMKEKVLDKSGSEKALKILINDFCSNVKDSLKERLLTINELFTIDPSSAQFEPTCKEKY